MSLALSFILLSGQTQPAESEIRNFMAASWPNLAPISNYSADEATISFDLGEIQVALGIMPAPIPWSDLEGPCATSILWNDAENTVKGHQAHIIVTVRGELNPIELSTVLTQVTAATMHASPAAIGVFWGNAALLIPKTIFTDFAVEVLPHEVPLHIWIDFRAGTNESGSTSGFTTGMAALGHMEFETSNCPETSGELKERFLSLCSYVIEHGPVLRDGNTVGTNADEKIYVAYADSNFGCKDQVIQLVYDTPPAKKSKWKFWS